MVRAARDKVACGTVPRLIYLNLKTQRKLLFAVTVISSGYMIGLLRSTKAFYSPLPEKSTVEKFRFSAEFIETRRQALDMFINRVASHPELRKSEDLKIFLQEDEEKMERIRTLEIGYFKKKPADLIQIFKRFTFSSLVVEVRSTEKSFSRELTTVSDETET
ncbi:Sorting nexin 1 [Ananas comosus]|uniref:Sorting nexin 1 n=1 Tax=Ananas comosus TaxID=4615 RepID=A0A199UM47_ANACO|nr:Sorting nexin 1 [Ananas comosus]